MTVNPRTYMVYRVTAITGKATVQIALHPKQRWEAINGKDCIEVARNNVILSMPKEDFEKHWEVVE